MNKENDRKEIFWKGINPRAQRIKRKHMFYILGKKHTDE